MTTKSIHKRKFPGKFADNIHGLNSAFIIYLLEQGLNNYIEGYMEFICINKIHHIFGISILFIQPKSQQKFFEVKKIPDDYFQVII